MYSYKIFLSQICILTNVELHCSIIKILKDRIMESYKYYPTLEVVNDGQFYDVSYRVWDKGEVKFESVSFRTYDEAKVFFNTIPLE